MVKALRAIVALRLPLEFAELVPKQHRPLEVPQQQHKAGEVQRRATAWRALARSKLISQETLMDVVEGVTLRFETTPTFPPFFRPSLTGRSKEQEAMLRKETEKMVEMGAWRRLDGWTIESVRKTNRTLAPCFLLPKKEVGEWRMVVNERHANESATKYHFKLTGLPRLLEMIRILGQGTRLAVVDIAKAFYSMATSERTRRTCFTEMGGEIFEERALMMGHSSSPFHFVRALEGVLALARRCGLIVFAFIDDIVILTPPNTSLEAAEFGVQLLMNLLSHMGFSISLKRPIEVATRALILGFLIDTISMTVMVPEEKAESVRADVLAATKSRVVTRRALAALIGRLEALKPGIRHARHLTWPLRRLLNRFNQWAPWSARTRWSAEAQAALKAWSEVLATRRKEERVPIVPPAPDLVVETDASDRAVGINIGLVQHSVEWTGTGRGSNFNELRGMHLGLQVALQHMQTEGRPPSTDRTTTIRLLSDNVTAVASINRQGGATHLRLAHEAESVWRTARSHNVWIEAQWIPGAKLVVVDQLSRYWEKKLDFRLSLNLCQRIQTLWGKMEIDLFASEHSAVLPRYCSLTPPTGGRGECVALNAFSLSRWPNKCWCHPPIALIGKALIRAREDRVEHMIMVTPFWPGLAWWPILEQFRINPPLVIDNASGLLFADSSTELALPTIDSCGRTAVHNLSFRR